VAPLADDLLLDILRKGDEPYSHNRTDRAFREPADVVKKIPECDDIDVDFAIG
jgi:hypothetical protein